MAGENIKCALVAASSDETFSASLDMGQVCTSWALQVNPSAALSAGVVMLELSLDGVNFVTNQATSGALSGAGSVLVFAVDKPARYARARIETAVAGGTVTVFIAGTNTGSIR